MARREGLLETLQRDSSPDLTRVRETLARVAPQGGRRLYLPVARMETDGEKLLGGTETSGFKLRDLARHLALGLALALYTVFGGLVFRALEQPAELGRLEEAQRDVSRSRAAFTLEVGRLHNATRSGFYPAFLKQLAEYETAVQSAAQRGILVPIAEGTSPEGLIKWQPLQAIFFASTVITTIGYGNIAPVTGWGRTFCVLYAIIGIPLCLTAVADLGVLAARGLPDPALLTDRLSTALKSLLSAFAALLLLFAFLAVGALLFMHLEDDWDFWDSFYFCFITMTTIGFGDLVPQKPQYMLLCTVYILIGLGLTSTIIELVRLEYAKSWKRLEAMAEALRRLAEAGGGSASVDLSAVQGDLLKALNHLGKGKKSSKNWEKTVNNLVDSLNHPKSKPKIVQIIVYESSV